jgi:CheY-like chemotaxis protein
MRVLLCDDNRDAADVLCAVLQTSGHEVSVCYDGRRCLEKARQWRPQVALLDLGMPGMTGYEVAKSIRRMDFGRQALLIAITGYGTQEDRRLTEEAGFDLHLTKPAAAQGVLDVIEEYAARSAR